MFYTINVVKNNYKKNYKKVEKIMTKNKEITKAQALEMALEIVKKVPTQEQTEGLTDKLQAMLDQQKKQDSAKRGKKGTSKVAKEKTQNMELVRKLFIEMEEPEALTLAEIAKAIPSFNDFTPQKTSAIMKALVDNGEMERTTKDKKVAFAPVI